MIIYISGPITGLDSGIVAKTFAYAEQLVRQAGHIPINPLKNGVSDNAPYEEHIWTDLGNLMKANAILFLDNWRNSRGCRMEYAVAEELHKLVLPDLNALEHITINNS